MTNGFQLTDGVLTAAGGISELHEGLFAQRQDIRRAVLPEGLVSIGDEAFSGCEALEELTLPAGLESIGAAAFMGCSSLRHAALPPSLRVIMDGAFLSCASLTGIRLPEGLERIGAMAFWHAGLREISVPAGAASIGESAFWECAALRRADVLGGETHIDANVFGLCGDMTEGYIAPGYPDAYSPAEELIYTLLWCSCPQRHGAETSRRAEAFIRSREALIMERVLKSGNVPALTGLVSRSLLERGNIDGYLRSSLQNGQTELSALLLEAKSASNTTEDEFEL